MQNRYIDKQTAKRKELKLPKERELSDIMYKEYDRLEVIQKVGELESQLDIPYNMRLTRWFGDYHMYEAVENLCDIDTQIQERLELLSTKSMDEIKELLYRKEWAAASELKGYQWTHYDDGSGSLKDATDKKIAGYDLYTREIRFGDEWKNFSYGYDFDLEFVKEYVEGKQVDVLSKEIGSIEQSVVQTEQELTKFPDGIDEARLNEIVEEMMLEEQAFMNGPELEM